MALTRVKYNQVNIPSVFDHDLIAIGELNGTGYLRRTGQDQWSIDPEMVQNEVTATVGTLSGTANIELSNATPLITDGVQLLSAAITPNNLAAKIRISGSFMYSADTDMAQVMAFVFRENLCIGVTGAYVIEANTTLVPIVLDFLDTPSVTVPVTYSVRIVGVDNGYTQHTWYINQMPAPSFGGLMSSSTVTLREVVD